LILSGWQPLESEAISQFLNRLRVDCSDPPVQGRLDLGIDRIGLRNLRDMRNTDYVVVWQAISDNTEEKSFDDSLGNTTDPRPIAKLIAG
jgi:hypothetical protein